MPYQDRTKARLEHELSTLRREVGNLRSKQDQRRKQQRDQAVLQARLEREIHDLQAEVETLRLKRKVRECGEAESSTKLNQHIQKLDEHVAKQERYISFLEKQINHTRLKYQKRMTNVHQSADQLEEKLQNVRTEMSTIKKQASEMDQLNKRLTCLTAKVERRDKLIAHYECQQTDFMRIVADLMKQIEQQGGCGDARAEKKPEFIVGSDANTDDVVPEDFSSDISPQPKLVSYFSSLATALRMKLEA